MKVGATTADESIEISRDWITIGSGKPVESLTSVIAFADNLSRTTKPGWFIPDIDKLRANVSLIQQIKGKEYFWSSTPISQFVWGKNPGGRDDVVMETNIGLFRGVALRTFVEQSEPCTPPPTTTTVAPTTTVPLTCAAGGLCAVGDTGPGGGRIFSANSANDGSSTYLEVAPADWVATPPPSSLVSQTKVIVAPGSTGDGADALASSYRGGGKSDWRLPDVAELALVCRSANNTLSAGAGMWATDASSRTGKSTMSVASGCSASAAGGPQEGVVRPVRRNVVSAAVRQAAVDYYAVNPTTTTSTTLPPTTTTSSTTTTSTTSTTTTTTSTTSTTTTTTIRPTTTTARPTTTTTTVALVPCTNLANCQVGQRGPGGGIIIKRSGDSTAPRYLEIAPAGWNNGGRDALVSALDAPATASGYKGGGLNDWRLPNSLEIEDLCKFATDQLGATESYCPEPMRRIDASFGDGTGARGQSFYWHGVSPIRERMDFASTRRMMAADGNAYVRPVRSWGYVPPTTTTTIPMKCAEGGVCRIGDISPTGGLIVDFSGSGNAMTYTELAPKTWNGGTNDPRLTKEAAQEAIRRYGTSAKAPWALPTDRQMRAAFVFFANNPTFGADCRAQFSSWRSLSLEQDRYRHGWEAYWIAAPGRADKFDNFEMATGAAYYDVRTPMSFGVRPFAEQPYRGGGNPQRAQWSNARCEYQTIPTTTTTTIRVGCAGRGICRVGDVGRYGGIIIAVQFGRSPGDITYTEMQRATSRNFDCQGSVFGNSCVSGQYDNFVRTRGLNGTFDNYPTTSELRAVAASSDLKLKLAMRDDWYFSSTYRKTRMLTGDVNADSLADLGRSLEINDSTLGVAINMGTRAQSELNYAFFRGVNRWKCEYSCIQN